LRQLYRDRLEIIYATDSLHLQMVSLLINTNNLPLNHTVK